MTDKYLRINNKETVDMEGGDGKQPYFLVHVIDAQPNKVKLESEQHKGKFLMLARKQKSLKVGDGQNDRSIFVIFRK